MSFPAAGDEPDDASLLRSLNAFVADGMIVVIRSVRRRGSGVLGQV